jgi:heparin/heparan-sulfate lyase
MRTARHFPNMGQIFMRSRSGKDDTYALFSSGGILIQHRHYDNNNFVIFKRGYLAMDTGTRPEPGLHLPFYFARTVAHNCITVKMPGEKYLFIKMDNKSLRKIFQIKLKNNMDCFNHVTN